MAKQNKLISDQLCAMIDQNKEMVIQSKAATVAAEAAKKSNDIAADTAKKQLRAYIITGSSDPNVEPFVVYSPESNAFASDIALKNSGQTPAHKVTTWVTCEFVAVNTEAKIDPKKTGTKHGPMTIGPGREWAITNTLYLADSEVPFAKAGTKEFWIVGRIEYRDAFDGERFTEFRFRQGDPIGENKFNLEVMSEGNDSV